MENTKRLKSLELILCRPQIIQRILHYLTLNEWLNFVSAFPSWNYCFPHEILLSENGSPTLLFLLRRHLIQHIRTLRLTSPGPVAQGGAVGSIQKCILSNPFAFSRLQRLDLSVQMQPIDRLLEIFTTPAFPQLRYLSVRPTEPDSSDNLLTRQAPSIFVPPRLEVMKCHLTCSLVDERGEYIRVLLKLMQNVVHLTVCERMVGKTPWSQYLRQTGPFRNLESLQTDAKSDLLNAVNEMLFINEASFFPKLRSVNIGTMSSLKTLTTFSRRFLNPLEIAFSGFGQPTEGMSSAASNQVIQVGRSIPVGRGLLKLELIFFPDNINYSTSSAVSLMSQFGHPVSTLVVTVQHLVIPESHIEYIDFLRRFKALCREHLFPVLKRSKPSLKALELPVELIDSRSVDADFEAFLVFQRGMYPSIKSVSITSPPTFPFCNRSRWHSCHCLDTIPHTLPLKNICGLFCSLEELVLASDSHLDPDDLREVAHVCPELKRLYIYRWPVSMETHALAIQEILLSCSLEVLCLVVDSLRIQSGPNARLLCPRSWTLKYLYIDCIYQPFLSKEEFGQLVRWLPKANWITIANREASRCLEFRRSRTAETICEMRLDSGRRGKEPRSFAPELYDVVWKGEEKMKYFVAEWCHPCEA
ncbi:unnamed protein product [Mesocestoides corti]|uniref:F-box domain-containing protein n=1 Tax=Mesocestoides corti TaxID=53468 RepID=A0A0R3U6N3_MESCO|nr:unnamed protein product [Mesocestoides corti]